MSRPDEATRIFALEYHDVLAADDDSDASGFAGGSAASYKMPVALFRAHLDALANAGVAVVNDVRAPGATRAGVTCRLTFDDGGESALRVIADMLEARDWRGHFFVTTDRIGTPGFLSAAQIAELRRRGHVVGSHSRSHPTRFARLAEAAQRLEWRESCAELSAILGEKIDVASVPGGYFDETVARIASEEGLRWLFTSEPTHHVWLCGDCRVSGRYTLRRSSPAHEARQLVGKSPVVRSRHWLAWNLKKLAKGIGGDSYLRVRALLLRDRPSA
jgi:peptidoglycan/xylan/chitin deacetylase (PgdA/CDA1 family)